MDVGQAIDDLLKDKFAILFFESSAFFDKFK